MKKFLSLLLAAMMLLSFAACSGGGKTAEATQEPTEAPTAEPTEEPNPDYEAAQQFACFYITECAHVFKNPLSVEVLKAWYWKDPIGQYYFTLQLNVKNSAGIVETVYYGNKVLGFKELTEKAAKNARNMTVFDVGDYFKENAIDAMQNGTELDASDIQSYFIKNYK